MHRERKQLRDSAEQIEVDGEQVSPESGIVGPGVPQIVIAVFVC